MMVDPVPVQQSALCAQEVVYPDFPGQPFPCAQPEDATIHHQPLLGHRFKAPSQSDNAWLKYETTIREGGFPDRQALVDAIRAEGPGWQAAPSQSVEEARNDIGRAMAEYRLEAAVDALIEAVRREQDAATPASDEPPAS